ncbi:MAG: malonyl-ACP O-methyltransferase BioC [Legionellales bacterium]|nr:malonyl-ACP O-methyltransferase BioC [Legionellales bacterium]
MNSDLQKKQHIQYCFNRSADDYEQAAIIQKHALDRLLSLFACDGNYLNENIIDLGCGTGQGTELLAKSYPQARILGIDFSEKMLAIARTKQYHATFIDADFDHLPFVSDTISTIFSSMALQWSLSLTETLSEWHRILKPNGRLVCCTLNENSLHELKDCWQQISNSPSINYFHSTTTIQDTLFKQGFNVQHMLVEKQTMHFDDLRSLLYNFKKVGANFSISANKQARLTKKSLTQIAKCYENYRTHDKLPLTYELCYFIADKISGGI